jgi:hypothetical protein
LGRTEDDINVKKAVDEAQAYYNAQEKQEWVEWAMAESVAEGPVTTQVTTQDREAGESE